MSPECALGSSVPAPATLDAPVKHPLRFVLGASTTRRHSRSLLCFNAQCRKASLSRFSPAESRPPEAGGKIAPSGQHNSAVLRPDPHHPSKNAFLPRCSSLRRLPRLAVQTASLARARHAFFTLPTHQQPDPRGFRHFDYERKRKDRLNTFARMIKTSEVFTSIPAIPGSSVSRGRSQVYYTLVLKYCGSWCGQECPGYGYDESRHAIYRI